MEAVSHTVGTSESFFNVNCLCIWGSQSQTHMYHFNRGAQLGSIRDRGACFRLCDVTPITHEICPENTSGYLFILWIFYIAVQKHFSLNPTCQFAVLVFVSLFVCFVVCLFVCCVCCLDFLCLIGKCLFQIKTGVIYLIGIVFRISCRLSIEFTL